MQENNTLFRTKIKWYDMSHSNKILVSEKIVVKVVQVAL